MQRRTEAVAPPIQEHIYTPIQEVVYVAVVVHPPRAPTLWIFLPAPGEAIEGQIAVAAPPIHRA